MRNQVKAAMILCFVALTLFYPASLKLAGSGSALAVQDSSDILNFVPAITAKKGPILQTPVVNGASVTLRWSFNHWPTNITPGEGYCVEESTSPRGPFTEITRSAGRAYTSFSFNRNVGTYYYRVRAFFNPSYSPYGNMVSARPTLTVYTYTWAANINNRLQKSDVYPGYENTVYANPAGIAAGRQWMYSVISGVQNYIEDRTVLFFDIQPLISGKTINRAILRLYPYQVAAESTTYRLMAFAGPWSANTITYNNCPYVYLDVIKTVNSPTTTGSPLEIDVTDMVQYWAAAVWANNGFIFYDPNQQYPYDIFNHLRVTWFYSLSYNAGSSTRPQLYLEVQNTNP